MKNYCYRFFYFVLFFSLLNSLSFNSFAQTKNLSDKILPGKYKGYTLLPNGWKLSPEGEQVPIGELPLNMVVTNNGLYAITSNSGMGENSFSVIDLKHNEEVQRYIISQTWYGLAFNDDDSKLYASGGNNNLIYEFDFKNGKLILRDSIVLGAKFPKGNISITGICFVKNKNILLAVSKESCSLYVCDVTTRNVLDSLKLNGECYDVKCNNSGTKAFVSIWGKADIDVIDLSSLKVINKIPVGDHPCEIAITKEDSRLFVANANDNSVSVVDLKSNKVSEKINSALSPDVPYGSTPNSLSLCNDDKELLIANADNNYLAVFDVSQPNKARSLGFIPVGWYPTSVRYDENTKQILVANGKGLSSMANPEGPKPGIKNKHVQYIGSLFKGTLSIINYPNKNELEAMTKKVYSNTPFTSKKEIQEGNQHVIPVNHNLTGSEKIKHVFYIIKENRTYDQIYGDMKEGNGDSALCFFPYKFTPNQHNLAKEFTLYDNFYADAEVSADGHNWSTAAYASDYVEKLWPVNYSRRGQKYNFEGGDPIAAPSSGYIWNDVLDHNKTFRNYGEFTEEVKNSKQPFQARDEDLKPYTDSQYPGWDLSISDLVRFEKWKDDFEHLVAVDSLPNMSLLRLPNDHTWGTAKGRLTPWAYVSQNDYALGRIVETISKSKDWDSSIIFVVEDDAQDGSDHVDAHRSCLLVIGPYVKKHFVDHTMYSTSSVLKTIELILGLPPMTQYDLSAAPILHSITDIPNLKSFEAISPLIDINATNTGNEYGSAECDKLNFTKEDAVPDQLFNEILWKDIKGKNSIMPAPVRSAFVRVVKNDNDEDGN